MGKVKKKNGKEGSMMSSFRSSVFDYVCFRVHYIGFFLNYILLMYNYFERRLENSCSNA